MSNVPSSAEANSAKAGGLTNASVGAFAIAPSDPHIIYVGTGEADMRSDITYGNGVYKSTDGGTHWQHIGLEDTRQIGKILVDPHNPNIVSSPHWVMLTVRMMNAEFSELRMVVQHGRRFCIKIPMSAQ